VKLFYLFSNLKEMGIIFIYWFLFFFTFIRLGAVKKGQIVRVDKEKYLNSINVSIIKTKQMSFFFLYTNKIQRKKIVK
jgi:hypothetical protein